MTPAAYAVIDLEAVRHNLEQVRAVAPKAKIMAVIKANGYGHGLLRMAGALRQVDAFAVARVDEGIRLRNAGFEHKVAVLEGFSSAEEFSEMQHYRLDTVVHCAMQLDILEAACRSAPCVVWLKFDSGMNRLGFKTNEFESAFQRLSRCPSVVQPVNLMTHFANADDIHDEKTLQQIRLFNDMTADLPGERSMANSAGIMGWETSITDWVRPGIMLYGISPFPGSDGREFDLRPVMALHSRLIAVKRVGAGEPVGYGGSWQCDKAITLGVVAIGYGDGYPRYAKAGTPVLVNQRRVPLIGRVSMDMITVDLSELPDAKVGDPVILWGDGLPVEEIAQWSDTIPYTLVCGVTQRVQLLEKR